MSQEPSEPIGELVFTGGDIVRLVTATYLPLCRSLRAAGVIDTKALAQRIALRAAPEGSSSWGALAMALAEVLAADADRHGPSNR